MLTKKQRIVLNTLEDILTNQEYFPSIRELGRQLGLSSPATVHQYLLVLEKKGYLKRIKKRGFELLETVTSSEEIKKVPLAGVVPAGSPDLIFEDSAEEIEVPGWMIGQKKEVFAITVKGESMIDAYINDEDKVIIEKANSASSGEMVVARLDDGSVTLKRLKLKKGKIFLFPENPAFEPIEVKELKIIGKVIGVLRKY